MPEKQDIQKSILEQIYDDLFLKLENNETFDQKTISNLKISAQNGNLKNILKLKEIIENNGEI